MTGEKGGFFKVEKGKKKEKRRERGKDKKERDQRKREEGKQWSQSKK